MERKFQEELDELKQQLLDMGSQVERNIGDAVRSLIQRDRQLAESVLGRDVEIDRAEIRIDEQCFSLLALRQPVAVDLRFITTAMKIVKDLERVGDMAVDIAERTIDLIQEPFLKDTRDLSRMAEAALEMLKNALDAYVHEDVDLARQVIEQDDEVDELYRKIFTELLRLMAADRNAIHQGTQLSSVAKFLERTGDHSSNIAEMVVFMVEARDIRQLEKIRQANRE